MWDDSENTWKTYGAGKGRVPCTVKCRWQKWKRIWRRNEGEGGERSRTEWRIGKEEEWEDITKRTIIREDYYGLASPTLFHYWQLGGTMKVNSV